MVHLYRIEFQAFQPLPILPRIAAASGDRRSPRSVGSAVEA
jgi:hypothetical protein